MKSTHLENAFGEKASVEAADLAPDSLRDDGVSGLAFRETMSRFPAAVCVVTSNGAAGRCGITASSVCPVTDEPPIVSFCINRQSRTNRVFKINGSVAINLLRDTQVEVAKCFAGQTDLSLEDRFSGWHWSRGIDGAPLLDQAVSTLQGRIGMTVEAGTHTVFLVTLTHACFAGEAAPSIYFHRTFSTVRLGGST